MTIADDELERIEADRVRLIADITEAAELLIGALEALGRNAPSRRRGPVAREASTRCGRHLHLVT